MDRLHFLLAAWHVMLSIIGVVLLLNKNLRHNKWVILAFIITSLPGVEYILGSAGLRLIPNTNWLNDPVWHLGAYPAIFLYIKALVYPDDENLSLSIMHFLPLTIILCFSQLEGYSSYEFFNSSRFVKYVQFVSIVAFISLLFYSYQVQKIVKANKPKYQQEYTQSNIFYTLNWVNYLLVSMLVATIAVVVLSLFGNKSHIQGKEAQMLVVVNLFTGALVYFTTKQRTLFVKSHPKIVTRHTTAINEVDSAENHDTSYIGRLESYIEKHKPYLNPKLRMHDLSEGLNIPKHVLSRIINENYKVNFFHFVNQHRIQHLLKLLSDDNLDVYTVEALALKSGFNSKSTFYKSFKEIMGVSQMQYLSQKDN